MKMRSGIVVLPALALVIFCCLAVAGETKETLSEKDYIAVVNGAVITEEDLQREVSMAKKQYEAMGSPLMDAQIEQIKERIIGMLIDRELLYQAAKEEGITVDDQVVQERLESWKAQFAPEGSVKETIAEMGFTEEEFRSQLKKLATIEAFIEKKFRSTTTVSDEEAKEFYDSHPEFFQKPEQVKASHILIKVDPDAEQKEKDAAREELTEVKKQLDKDNGDFAELAKEHSQCPSSEKGGDLGYFRRGMMVKPFEDVAFSLEPDGVSDIVETQFGYHLIKVTGKQPSATISLEESRRNIKQHLKQQKVNQRVKDYVTTLQDKADIKRGLQAEKTS